MNASHGTRVDGVFDGVAAVRPLVHDARFAESRLYVEGFRRVERALEAPHAPGLVHERGVVASARVGGFARVRAGPRGEWGGVHEGEVVVRAVREPLVAVGVERRAMRRGGENLERLVHQRRGRRRVVAGEVGVDGFLQRAPCRANLVGGRFRGNVQDGVVVDEGDATAIRDGVVARTGRKSRIVPTTVAGARRARDDGARVADAGARRGANIGEDANIGEHRGEHREDAREGVKGRKRDVPARTSDPRHQSAKGRHFLS